MTGEEERYFVEKSWKMKEVIEVLLFYYRDVESNISQKESEKIREIFLKGAVAAL